MSRFYGAASSCPIANGAGACVLCEGRPGSRRADGAGTYSASGVWGDATLGS